MRVSESPGSSGAVFSEDEKFRYMLFRRWDVGPVLPFVMLNPSTADAYTDDPTIRKCRGFASRMGYGALVAVNLYAYRATDPRDLARAGYPVGPENLQWVREVCADYATLRPVICAWGSKARPDHAAGVLREVSAICAPFALRVNVDGSPAHPLMLSYDVNPAPYHARA